MKNDSSVPQPSSDLLEKASIVRRSAVALGQTTDAQRRFALSSMADALDLRSIDIINANVTDLEKARNEGLNESLISRLELNQKKLKASIEGVRQVACLEDPIGVSHFKRELDEGLVLERVTVPLGVLGVIFEARPDAVIQIASLSIKSGNGSILKGGREASETNEAIIAALKEGLSCSDIDPGCLCLLTTRQESMALLQLDGLVDLIIPRGSNELVRFIQDNTRIPVLGHADGICHLYIDSEVDLEEALRIAIDSKVQYAAACNAIETLLVHKDVATAFLKDAIPAFNNVGVTLRGDLHSQSLGVEEAANDGDWSTEYLDLILSIKVVYDIQEALEHIRRYGSRHTEAIVTSNNQTAELFLGAVDSAGVYHNCSTRFADGFRYGFGAEVGISTQTLPPRGPVGLEGLVTYRYFLRGNGHIADDFSSGRKFFSHKDIK